MRVALKSRIEFTTSWISWSRSPGIQSSLHPLYQLGHLDTFSVFSKMYLIRVKTVCAWIQIDLSSWTSGLTNLSHPTCSGKSIQPNSLWSLGFLQVPSHQVTKPNLFFFFFSSAQDLKPDSNCSCGDDSAGVWKVLICVLLCEWWRNPKNSGWAMRTAVAAAGDRLWSLPWTIPLRNGPLRSNLPRLPDWEPCHFNQGWY